MTKQETRNSGDGTRQTSSNKGETQPKVQQGAPSTSNKKKKGKHEKDDSSGAEHNTTKKQGNSI